VGVESLVYRCHEVGTISDATYRRAFQRLNQLHQLGLFAREPVGTYPGEVPALISQAFSVAQQHGLTVATRWRRPSVRSFPKGSTVCPTAQSRVRLSCLR